jgi:peptidoglycan/LPS O-acetylase OafA/YrhL
MMTPNHASETRRHTSEPGTHKRLLVLDGWRAISILLVLAAHLLPLGPKAYQLNATAGPMGMALFFTLSGFLITRFLIENSSVTDFLIRRFFRIVPLAWFAMAVAFTFVGTDLQHYPANFLFFANWPSQHQHLTGITSHFWSLCVEMQFYMCIALVFAFLGKRGLYLLPAICVSVTLLRVSEGALVDIVTWRRIDEILAGGILALLFSNKLGQTPKRVVASLNSSVLLLLLAVSSHPNAGGMNYLRPYFAALLVGSTLFEPSVRVRAILENQTLRYIAEISFAIYVIHHILMYSWLASGEKIEKYLKLPLLIAATFGLAHVSTRYFEQWWIDLGKRLSARLVARKTVRSGKQER